MNYPVSPIYLIYSFCPKGVRAQLEIATINDNEEIKLFDTQRSRSEFSNLLDSVTHPIHPTEVFDMIVGTSTGGLISFGLVGGNFDPSTGERQPMSISQVIDMYKIATPRIFEQPSCNQRFFNWIGKKLTGMPIIPYGQEGLDSLLKEYFGNATLKDFHCKCIAGAVTRRFDAFDKNWHDTLQLFDTKSPVSYSAVSVMKASADAPVYFTTPTMIGDHRYVDGGVGGNCPLVQAIPRMRKLTRGGILNSVLSIAPPRYFLGQIPDSMQAFFWMQYFPGQISDGFAVFMDTKNHYEDAVFQRLCPNSEAAELFPMDELDIDAMLNAVKVERLNDPAYLQRILATALVIAARKAPKDRLDAYREDHKVVPLFANKKTFLIIAEI
jgi:hypothetical protein